MSEVQVTLYGWVGTEVELKKTGRADVATLRVGTTPRVRDGRGGFKDGLTVWTSVTCWRTLAHNVASSVHVGDPVVVIGKVRTKRWVTDNGEPRERSHVEAITVCHDLARGTSVFRKNPRSEAVPDDEDDAVNEALEAAERRQASIDPATGEVSGGVEHGHGAARPASGAGVAGEHAQPLRPAAKASGTADKAPGVADKKADEAA